MLVFFLGHIHSGDDRLVQRHKLSCASMNAGNWRLHFEFSFKKKVQVAFMP